jgi:glycosyltransferase involved in cell wall biosynthesis
MASEGGDTGPCEGQPGLTVAHDSTNATLSFVLPVYNEQENLELLFQRLRSMIEELNERCEVIMVDDGSQDSSYAMLRAIRLRDPRFKLVRLSRNFGHQAAITAGLDLARGNAVIVMDADLQHPPELVPAMVACWREGFEVITAVRRNRHGDTRFKRTSARAFYWLIRRLTRVEMTADAGDFRLVDRCAVEALRAMRENARYLRGMFSWVGFRQTTVSYDYHRRQRGQPKYDLARMLRLGVDGITSFSDLPLQLALHLGFIVAGLSFLAGVSDIVTKLVGGNTVPGWLSLAITGSFLGGMQLVILGVMGLYMGRMFDEVKNRPLYIVRELAGIDTPAAMQTRSMVVRARALQ